MRERRPDWADKKAEELICASRNWTQADRMAQMADALRNAERWRVEKEGGILVIHGKRLCDACNQPIENGDPVTFIGRWYHWGGKRLVHVDCNNPAG